MDINRVTAYELLKKEEIDDIKSTGYLLRHKKTGARIVLIENDDDNKVFNIAFRTPPMDGTGVAHILEHSVLCGSKNFPLKDPFVELAKGSLNTFLNAMTFPDKTMYPIASCNDQDFKNLMYVYLDAVFYPDIYEKEQIFRQEGWHYELNDGVLSYNGVVYNEMKGAFSSPDEILERAVLSGLFPDSPYGVEFGGDPEVIPSLTYEQFLDFHRRYYHPSNSYIYLYGKMDFEERLEWMDENYLKDFDRLDIDSVIPVQRPFPKRKELNMTYPVSENEPVNDNAYLSYSFVVSNARDIETVIALRVLDYALFSTPGAPVRQALLDAGIGKDVDASYNEELLQQFFNIVARGASEKDAERFRDVIENTLRDIVKNKIPELAIKAGINYYEFRFREADYSLYPKGLIYGIDMLGLWLYDDDNPFERLKLLKVFDSLKKKAGEGYFEELIERCFLDNPHSMLLVSVPERGLTTRKEKELSKKLEEYKSKLSTAQCQTIADEAMALKAYQEEPDSKEALSSIPVLKRSDIKKEARDISLETVSVNGIKTLYNELQTNGIAYLGIYFPTDRIKKEYIPYLGLLVNVLGNINTEHYTYAQLYTQINARTGGINISYSLCDLVNKPDGYLSHVVVRAKTLYDELPFVFEMIDELIRCTDFNDRQRLKQIVLEQKLQHQQGLSQAGHVTAMTRASAYYSEYFYLQDMCSGIGFYRMLEELEKNFDDKVDELIGIFKELMGCIFTKDNMFISYTCEKGVMEGLKKASPGLIKTLDAVDSHAPSQKWQLDLPKGNEAFKTAGQVQYVVQAGNFARAGYKFTGAMNVMKTILGYDYLWLNVRVKGGAYGCMSNFSRSGAVTLATYRDPNLKDSFAVFKGIPEYLENFDADEDLMTKYIIGTISGLDTPLTPSTAAILNVVAYLRGIKQEDVQRERDEILNADASKIRELAKVMRDVLSQNYCCVVGSEAAIERDKDLFNTVSYIG